MDNSWVRVIGEKTEIIEVSSSGMRLPVLRLETWNNAYDVWCCQVANVPATVLDDPGSCEWLTNDGDRWGRSGFTRDRRLFLATRLLVRAALSQYADLPPEEWRFEKTEFGRPYIAAHLAEENGLTGLQFSLSRSGSLAVCAVCRSGNIGVDIEDQHKRIDVAELSAGVLAASEMKELEHVSESNRKNMFLRLWTLKEAYLKACGTGLSVDTKRIVFTGLEAHPAQPAFASDMEQQSGEWHFRELLLLDHFIGALAYSSSACL